MNWLCKPFLILVCHRTAFLIFFFIIYNTAKQNILKESASRQYLL